MCGMFSLKSCKIWSLGSVKLLSFKKFPQIVFGLRNVDLQVWENLVPVLKHVLLLSYCMSQKITFQMRPWTDTRKLITLTRNQTYPDHVRFRDALVFRAAWYWAVLVFTTSWRTGGLTPSTCVFSLPAFLRHLLDPRSRDIFVGGKVAGLKPSRAEVRENGVVLLPCRRYISRAWCLDADITLFAMFDMNSNRC
jgi:hypothetical protein